MKEKIKTSPPNGMPEKGIPTGHKTRTSDKVTSKDGGLKIDDISCADKTCPVHGTLKSRGRIFKGYVTKKFPKRIVVEFERIVPVRKYERYAKRKTKIHARLPDCMEDLVSVGDYVVVQECRPLSKIIHFIFLKKVKEGEKWRL